MIINIIDALSLRSWSLVGLGVELACLLAYSDLGIPPATVGRVPEEMDADLIRFSGTEFQRVPTSPSQKRAELTQENEMFEDLEFHEADVVDIGFDGRDLFLRLDGVSTHDGFTSVFLEFKNVTRLEIDDAPSDKVEKHLDEGEILRADITNRSAKVFLIWYDYASRSELLEKYIVEFEQVTAHRYPDQRDRTGWDED